MENNNGRGTGIFYGVIGVATLVVTIIGATFAYFSASTNSDVDAITAGSTKLSLGFVDVDTHIKSNLIPAKETLAGWASDSKKGATGCQDDNNNNYCSVYQFTISNPSETTAQKIFAKFKVQTNTFPDANGADEGTESNLMYAIFRGSVDDVEGNIGTGKQGWSVEESDIDSSQVTDSTNLNGTVKGALGRLVKAKTAVPTGNTYEVNLPELTQTLKPQGAATYTVILWVREVDAEQNDDQDKAFAAGLTFNTSDGNTGVTAVLSTSG